MKILYIFLILYVFGQIDLNAAGFRLTHKMIKSDEDGFSKLEKEYFIDWEQVFSEKIANLEEKLGNLETENSEQKKKIETAHEKLNQQASEIEKMKHELEMKMELQTTSKMEKLKGELEIEMQLQTESLNERLVNQSYEVEKTLSFIQITMLDIAEKSNLETDNNSDQLNETLIVLEKLNQDIYRIENSCVTYKMLFDAETNILKNEIERLKDFHKPMTTMLPLCALTSSALVSHLKVGTRVVRSRDWQWDSQDFYQGKPAPGTVKEIQKNGWIQVKWESGYENNYRMGHQGKYDLKLAECP